MKEKEVKVEEKPEEVKEEKALVGREAFTNGLKKSVTAKEAYTNGLAKRKPGYVNGMKKPVLRAKPTKVSRMKQALVGTVVVVIAISIFAFWLFTIPSEKIKVDGNIEDWAGLAVYKDTEDFANPDIKITDYSVHYSGEKVYFYVKVTGTAFNGANSGYDTLVLFIDKDRNPNTGYRIENLGADAKIEVGGFNGNIHTSSVSVFREGSSSAKPEFNYSAWESSGGAVVEKSGTIVEGSAKITGMTDPVTLVVMRHIEGSIVQEKRGMAVVGKTEGSLVIYQSFVAGDIVNADDDVLELKLVAKGKDVHLESVSISNANVSLPKKDIAVNEEVTVSCRARSLTAGRAYEFGVQGADTSVPYRIVGSGGKAYFGSLPSGILIDGAFGDWQMAQKGSDGSGDAPPNIDLKEYASAIATNVYFYMAVDGSMLAGCEIPVVAGRPPVQPGPPAPVVIKENLGLDVARVYIDLMNSTINTFNPAMISHGYLIELQGRNGQVVSAKAWKWENGIRAEEIANAGIVHGLSDGKIEFSVAGSAIAGLNNDTKFYFEMSNWLGEKDASEFAYRAGRIQHEEVEVKEGAKGNQRGPIAINGDSQFTLGNGVVGGSGTQSDPYRIEGWDINANGGAYGIFIQNTRAYFVIRNCNLFNATNSGLEPYGSGIALKNVTNGSIDTNKCNNSRYGIYLYGGSGNNTVNNNNASSNSDRGIYLWSANNNTISNNNVSNNSNYGIYLYYSSYNNLSGNNASFGTQSGSRGIYLDNSHWNNLTNNIATYNKDAGIHIRYSGNNTLTGCNASFNSYPGGSAYGIYLTYANYTTIVNSTACNNSGNSGYGIRVENSMWCNIRGNNASGNSGSSYSTGIYLSFSSSNSISRNRATGSRAGIQLSESASNNITENIASNNTYGIYVYGTYLRSQYNTIFCNNASGNAKYGICLDYDCNYTTITYNWMCFNLDYGLYINGAQYCNIHHNNFISNKGLTKGATGGPQAYTNVGSSNWHEDAITEGNFWSNWDGNGWGGTGAYVVNASTGSRDWYPLGMPVLYPLNISSNYELAFYASLYGWGGEGTSSRPYIVDRYYINANASMNCTRIANTNLYLVIQNCTFRNATGSAQTGIYLENGMNATVFNNTIRNCRYGIYFYNAKNTTVSQNDITGITAWGICLSYGNGNSLLQNRVYGFTNPAIYVWCSNQNSIMYNQLNNTSSGIYLYTASKNTIAKNYIWNHSGSGIALVWSSSENNVTDNNVSFGNTGIDIQQSSNNNQIFYNWIYNNTNYGIYILSSTGNSIHHNNLIRNRNAVKGISDGRCQGYDNGGSNYWYSPASNEGNYWSNWDGNGWGTSSAYPIDGGSGSADWYPLTYRTFAPLHINGNGELVSHAKLYGWPGAGTSANPYLIDKYYLNGNATGTPSTYNIWIENTNLYFRISNSTIRNATNASAWPSGVGIAFNFVSNAVIDNNTILNNMDGIFLELSDGINIKNNNVSFNPENGIYLSTCRYLTLTGNVMYSDGIFLDGISIDRWNTHTIPTSNLVNGKAVRYYSNQTGITVPTNAGQIILANCTGMTVQNTAIDNTTVPLLIGFSKNSTITGNNFVDSKFCAIYMRNTENDTIRSNIIVRSIRHGIYSIQANNTKIENNTIPDNEFGIMLAYFTYGKIANNTFLRNSYAGANFAYGGNNVISGNNFSQNYYGLILTQSNSNTVTYNNFANNSYYAARVSFSSTNLIHHNNFFQNRGATRGNGGMSQAYDDTTLNTWYTGYVGNYWSNWDGKNWSSPFAYPLDGGAGAADFYPLKLPTRLPIRINSDTDFTPANGVRGGTGSPWDPYIISDWEIDGSGFGSCIYIGNTSAWFVIKNCYLHNASGNSNPFYDNAAVQLRNARNGVVRESVILNFTYGVYLTQGSEKNQVLSNTISNGSDLGQGVYLLSSSNNTIADNTIFDNFNGIYIAYSTNNSLINNSVASNGQYGVYIQDADGNKIRNNDVHHNSAAGIYSNYGDNNEILSNAIYANQKGVEFAYSTYNNITGNNISGNPTCGVHIYWSSHHNLIANNRIISNAWEGILIAGSGETTIICNNISQSGQYGLRFAYDCSGTVVLYNLFYANALYGIVIADSATNITIHHNSFIRNNGAGKGFIGNNQAYDEVSGNIWYDGAAQEGNYWSNWDGNGWGTSNAYPIGGYETSDYYPLSKPVLPPLHIKGNAEFAYYAGFYGWAGNGSSGNPYIIGKYYINGAGSGYCIWIENTTVYFNVFDCILRNASIVDDDPHGSGIAIYNGSNGAVSWNAIENNYVGVFLNNALNCTVFSNEFTRNGIAIFGDTVGAWNSHEIASTNLVNGKPVYYLKNSGAVDVPENAGQVLLANCSNIRVANISIENATVAVEAGFSTGITITNITSRNNLFGAIIVGCQWVNVTDSTFDTSYVSALDIEFTTNAGVYRNVFTATTIFGNTGVTAHNSPGIQIVENIINNIRSGIVLETCPLSAISKNVIDYRGEFVGDSGVRIYNSTWTTVTNNTIRSLMGLGAGIFLDNTKNDSVAYNDVSSGNQGIAAQYSDRIDIYSNTVYNNVQSGVYVAASTRCEVRYNNIYNNGIGIWIYMGNNNINITYNDVVGNGNGIFISASGNHNITYNRMISNSNYGLWLASTSNSKIFHNEISQNNIGIYIYNSVNNNLTYNNISWNTGYGVSAVAYSSSNKIHFNNFIKNNGATRGVNGSRQANDSAGGNSWYNGTLQKGNYWSNWDRSGWGTASAYPLDGPAGASDWYPLSEPAIPKLPRLHIIGNANFSYFASVYGWPGNGAPWNPYMIDGFEIDGGGDSYSIWIENTDVYFIIQKCKIWNATYLNNNPGGSGVALWNVVNGTLQYNNISLNRVGIYLSVCTGYNLITSNDVHHNTDTGISVDTSSDTGIYNNFVTSNYMGIRLVYSSYNTVFNNLLTGNNLGVYLYDTSTNNYVGYNTINGSANTGIHLQEYCDYNWIENNTVVSNNNGIYMYLSGNNVIVSNDVRGNANTGMVVDSCDNNNITGNNVSDNYYGIFLSSSCNNTVTNNTVSGSGNYGIVLFFSSNSNNITNNNASGNSNYGIYLFSSSNNIIASNIASGNTYHGICLDSSSDYNNITGNNASLNSQHGIYLYNSSNNNIAGNNVTSNSNWGIYLYNSSNNNIINNNASNNKYGVFLEKSPHNIISGNNISKNTYYGIILYALSNNNVVSNNNVFDNLYYGISLWASCRYNNISQNTVIANEGVGIGIYSSSYNDIYLNNVSWSYSDGVVLWGGSSNNNITYNSICNNTYYGINLKSGSTGNYIYQNYLVGNNGAGKGVIGNCQANDSVGGNSWYNGTLQRGNYWSNWDGNGWGSASAYPIDGGAGASDWYPIGSPVSEFGAFPPVAVALVLLGIITVIRWLRTPKNKSI
ncbi:MAG: right-handed parallel beta-helix repeat-containing protein [Thermoplasmata archaeon]|nr:right-handed parallel beta-helix repeat-containing protein [Thermoplasmata archaeon]